MLLENRTGLKKGPDIQIAGNEITLDPGPNIVPVKTESLTTSLKSFLMSVRSRYAQVGVDGPKRSSTKDQLNIFNHSQHPILLESEASLIGTYNVVSPPLEGRALLELYEAGDLKMEGEEGDDWQWQYRSPSSNSPADISGVFLKLSSRRWIPSPNNGPLITVSDNHVDPRAAIQDILEETDDPNLLFWIGETTGALHLSPNIEALVQTTVYLDSSQQISRSQTRHINSQRLEGGRTNWVVRAEISTLALPETRPNYIALRVWQNEKS